MNVTKILWPTDFSKNASTALPYVQSLSEKYNTSVHVLYVIDDLGHQDAPWYGEIDQDHLNQLYQWEQKKAEERLNEICQSHLGGCPLFVRHVAIGEPAQKIIEVADREKVDMIVMASRGRRSLFGFGSVTEKVMKNTRIPVVSVPVTA